MPSSRRLVFLWPHDSSFTNAGLSKVSAQFTDQRQSVHLVNALDGRPVHACRVVEGLAYIKTGIMRPGRDLQLIAVTIAWRKQRRLWRQQRR